MAENETPSFSIFYKRGESTCFQDIHFKDSIEAQMERENLQLCVELAYNKV